MQAPPWRRYLRLGRDPADVAFVAVNPSPLDNAKPLLIRVLPGMSDSELSTLSVDQRCTLATLNAAPSAASHRSEL